MRLTEFWERMDSVLGSQYARSWAADQSLATLGGQTVAAALASGEDTKVVWRAVVATLELPRSFR